MATASYYGMLPLIYLLVLFARTCHSYTGLDLEVEIGEPRYHPDAMTVHRVSRQVAQSDVTNPNLTDTVEDNHNYYQVRYLTNANLANNYWVDLSRLEAKKHPNLSTNPRLAAKIPLEFQFPFYGHNITELFLTTGGFMYLGTYVHRYLAATQYIAPLMANFDPASSPNCSIKYFTNGSLFIAEWTDILLGDNPTAGKFSFQSILKDTGEIIFSYLKVPIPVESISDVAHPTKLGVADAFYIDQKLTFWIKKRTIFEYHKVSMNANLISDATAVVLQPLPTCNLITDCESCTTSTINFNCTWCASAGRCSDGFDRNRQEWIDEKCEVQGNYENVPYNCPLPPVTRPTTIKPTTMAKHPSIYTDCSEGIACFNGGVCRYGECLCPTMYTGRRCEKYASSMGGNAARAGGGEPGESTALALRIGTILGSIFIAILVLALFAWIFYAYKYPNTNSGMFLIEVTRCRCRKKSDEGVGYHYHKPNDNEGEDIII